MPFWELRLNSLGFTHFLGKHSGVGHGIGRRATGVKSQFLSKIETLSNDLSQDQLSNFLDIINAMTALVEEASELSKTQDIDAPATISNSLVH